MRIGSLSQNSRDTRSPRPKPQNERQNHQTQSPSLPKSLKQASDFCPGKGTPSLSNWCHLIRSYLSQGAPREALLVYTGLRRKGVYLLGVAPLVLKACASLSIVKHGKALHAESIKNGVDFDVMIGTSLVCMYAKCGNVVDSRKVFDYMPERNAVTWNAMICGYLGNGDSKSAVLLFEKMSIRTAVTWIEMIDGFARSGILRLLGVSLMMFHLRMPQRNFFAWSSMISGYCKKGNVKEARSIFDRIPVRNLVNWNSLISGYAQNGFSEEALEAFGKMQAEGFEPDEVTIASVLSACSQLGLLDAGKKIHHMMNHKGIKLNQFVLNGLVDMYAKCGDLANARLIFEGMAHRNRACWNSMISGFAIHGQSKEALEFFGRMEDSHEGPDEITFLSVLSACAHGGFVNAGLEIFSRMEKYGLTTGIKHYGCLIDLWGAGRIKEAYDLIKRMPVKPNDVVWGALLGACRVHLDMEMADRVVEEIVKVDSNISSGCDSHYVLLSNIYAASDRWEKAEKTRMEMANKGFQKTPGCSSIMPGNTTHE
ncbi:hypothetical protein AAG906_024484 [Vitis piasezkii]